MNNKKIPTGAGTIVLIIIAFTVFGVVWKWGELQKVNDMQNGDVVINQRMIRNKQEKENKQGQSRNCSEEQNQKRICLDGKIVDRFDFACKEVFCSYNDKNTYRSPFIKKESNVYYEDYENLNLIDGADSETFKFIGSCGSVEMTASYYGKDNKYIYINDKKNSAIDMKSFEYLGSFSNGYQMPYSISISKDKNNIYFGCGKIDKLVDRNTFQILKNSYEKDRKRVYYLDRVLEKANPKTFEVIEYQKSNKIYGNFGLDDMYVYLEGVILKGIDPTVCKKNGLENCLPDNWQDLIDYAAENERGTKLK